MLAHRPWLSLLLGFGVSDLPPGPFSQGLPPYASQSLSEGCRRSHEAASRSQFAGQKVRGKSLQ